MHILDAPKIRRWPTGLALTATLSMILPISAFAAGSGMPWEEPLQQILESVQGPVAKIVAVIIIISTGLASPLVKPPAVSAS